MPFNHKKFYKRVDKLIKETLGRETMPLYMVPRHEWHAESPKNQRPMNHPVKYVVVWYNTEIQYCDSDDDCIRAVKELQRRDMAKGLSDIKYNFIVGGNGNTYEGRGWFFQPSMSLPYPRYHGNRVDIAYVGNFRGKNVLPFSMLDAQLNLVSYGKEKKYIVQYYTMIEEEQKFL